MTDLPPTVTARTTDVRDRLDALRTIVAADFGASDSAHDLDHLHRVERLAVRIAADEDADGFVVAAAALVHDYHRLDGSNGLGTTGAGADDLVRDALIRAGIGPEDRDRVAACVAHTDRYAIAGDDLTPPSVEAAIVRDADNLDAMGAIGIARAFAFGGVLGEPLWCPEEPIRERYDRGHAPSVIHHFHEKLLRLRVELWTTTGREIGARRHEELERFEATFVAEWRAER